MLHVEHARYFPKRCVICSYVPSVQSPTGGEKSFQTPNPHEATPPTAQKEFARSHATRATSCQAPPNAMHTTGSAPTKMGAQQRRVGATNQKYLISSCGLMRVTEGRPQFEESCHVQALSKAGFAIAKEGPRRAT